MKAKICENCSRYMKYNCACLHNNIRVSDECAKVMYCDEFKSRWCIKSVKLNAFIDSGCLIDSGRTGMIVYSLLNELRGNTRVPCRDIIVDAEVEITEEAK